MREFAYAIRRLRGSPMFTIAAAATLALAIGATASVFGLVEGVLLKAFPYRDPARVLTIWTSNAAMHLPKVLVAPADFVEYRAQHRAFADLAASWPDWGTVTGQQEPERVAITAVTPNYFSVLGITPALGRGLATDSSGPREALVSYDYWRTKFGGTRSVIGRKIVVDDSTYTIVGVMPPGLPQDTPLWLRLSFNDKDALAHRGWHLAAVFGRLRPGAQPEQARRELQVIAERLAATYPETNSGWTTTAVPLLDQLVGAVRSTLLVLLVAAACVLLIGAANLANLFLVRCLAREREMALRTALGATRNRLLRELLAEATVLGVVSGILGAALAYAGVGILRELAPASLPRVGQIAVDGRVIAFCAAASCATVLLFGLLPAWHTSRANLADLVREASRGTSSGRHHRLQDGLVVLQVAVTLVLLSGAGLLLKGLARFEQSDLGYRPGGVLTARASLTETRYATAARQATFAASVVDRLSAQPGVTSASASSALPGAATIRYAFQVIGDPPAGPGREATLRPIFVTPTYFHTMGIALRRGRTLLPTDDQRNTKVAVVDQVLARRFFGSRDPIGRQIMFLDMPDKDTLTIVGVVASVSQGGLVAEDVPVLYAAYAQCPILFDDIEVATRTDADPAGEVASLSRAVHDIDASVPVSDVKTLSALVAQSVSTTSFSTFLASLFAALALVLGTVGIYSVLAYIVSERRREIGIRLALGASRSNVMGDVFRRALALATAGIALGSMAAWISTRALAAAFTGVAPRDLSIYWGPALLFGVVALIAASVPAYRTTRVNPVVVLGSG